MIKHWKKWTVISLQVGKWFTLWTQFIFLKLRMRNYYNYFLIHMRSLTFLPGIVSLLHFKWIDFWVLPSISMGILETNSSSSLFYLVDHFLQYWRLSRKAVRILEWVSIGDLGLIPGLGTSPGEGKCYLPTAVFWPGESHGLFIVHGVDKSQTQLSNLHFQLVEYRFFTINTWRESLPGQSSILEKMIHKVK